MIDANADLVSDIAYALRFKAKLNGKYRREPDPRIVATAIAEHLSLMWNFERKPPLALWSVGLHADAPKALTNSKPDAL